MNNVLTLDFESKDEGITHKLGSGWAIGKCIPLGAGCKINDDKTEYLTNFDNVAKLVEKTGIILCHNAQYDCGILHMLGINYRDKLIVDTAIMAKCLYNDLPIKVKNLRSAYSLQNLLNIFLDDRKLTDELGKFVIDNPDIFGKTINWPKEEDLYKLLEKGKLLPHLKSLKLPNTKDSIPAVYNKMCEDAQKKADKIAYANMDLIQKYNYGLIERYCNQDVDGTYELYKLFLPDIQKLNIDLSIYSDLIKMLIEMRAKGVLIDLKQLNHAEEIVEPILYEHKNKIYKEVGKVFDLNNSKEFFETMSAYGIRFPTTEKGNCSCDKQFLQDKSEKYPILHDLLKYREANKQLNDYILGLRRFIQPYREGIGIIHPEFNIMGATATGRFSSSNPNMQQMPARDGLLGPLARSLVIPWENEQIYTFDYGCQEPRLVLHYSKLLNFPGCDYYIDLFKEDKSISIYDPMMERTGFTKPEVKVLFLGSTYGMGLKSLASKLDVTQAKAQVFRQKFFKDNPYIKYLDIHCQNLLKNRGYIKSLLNRKFEISDEDFHYKGLNKLIQGGAGDQLTYCMVMLYRKGIKPILLVHDEAVFSLTSDAEAAIIQETMENSINFKCPMYVDWGKGNNWNEAK